MDLVRRAKEAFLKAVDQTGGKLVRLQEKTGVDYSIINRLNSGKRDFKDLPLQTLIKLFPELRMYFFREEYPSGAFDKSNLSPGAKKIAEIYEGLNEEGQLDLLTEAGAIRERHSKNGHEDKIDDEHDKEMPKVS
jgi:hypothetical protein